MIRRLIIRVIVFLLLGAIVNVAVAWACVLWSPETALVDGVECPTRWPASVRHEWPETPSSVFMYEVVGISEIFALGEERQTTTIEWEFQHSMQAGLPVRSLYCDRQCMANWFGVPKELWLADTWSDGITIADGFQSPTSRPITRQCFPTRPLWPGFAINTIFYAAVLWLLFAAPGFVRRRIRRFRGRCLHCGYDLRGQPPDSKKCPECGHTAL